MARTKLTDEQVRTQLASLPGWQLVNGKLHRELIFADFIEAFGFMTSLALIAQASDHHPEWSNVYNRVVIELWTHDVAGITHNDFELAEAANKLSVGRLKTA